MCIRDRACVTEILPHSGAGKRGEILQRGWIGRGGGDDNRVVQRTLRAEMCIRDSYSVDINASFETIKAPGADFGQIRLFIGLSLIHISPGRR